MDENNEPIWEESNSANIGDEITYKIEFTATNYDGDKKIKYYQIHDEKGDAIWADFESFEVYVNGVLLPRGYYLDQANMNNGDWEFLNENSDHPDSWKNQPAEKKNANNAQWYLVHLGYDQFRITIPWLQDHTLNASTDANNVTTGRPGPGRRVKAVPRRKDGCRTGCRRPAALRSGAYP